MPGKNTSKVLGASNLRLVQLNETHLPAVHTLFGQCSSYFKLAFGHAATPDLTRRIFELCPDGGRSDAKFALGVIDEHSELLGYVDVSRDFPLPGIWTLGLLLVLPEKRKHGLGAQALKLVEGMIRQAGGEQSIRLGVMAENRPALRFWLREGFEEIARRDESCGGRPSKVVVMGKPLYAEEPSTGEGSNHSDVGLVQGQVTV